MKNHLGKRHALVNASQHKITVGPQRLPVYGMWFDPGFGYHVDNTTGIPTGNEPESIYAVMSGTHFNGACWCDQPPHPSRTRFACNLGNVQIFNFSLWGFSLLARSQLNDLVSHFTRVRCSFDYGNSETDDHSDGAGTMEAIYFGDAHWQGNSGAGSGPWVGADLECGTYYGGGNETKVNNKSQPLPYPFVSLYLRGGTDGMALKGGDATNGPLMTMYDGPRPDCAIAGTCQRHGNHTYQPMSKRGAIVLATGGDNSNGAMGKFYEGVMATGVTTDATDAAVQANIVAVGYRNLVIEH